MTFKMMPGWQVNECLTSMIWLANFLRNYLPSIFALCDPVTGKDYPIDDAFPYRICTDGGLIAIRLTTNNKIVVVECDIKYGKTIYTVHVYESAEAMQMYFKSDCEDNALILCVEKIFNTYDVLEKISKYS